MDRQTQLLNLQNYMKEVDKDITMILQNLQWDRSVFEKEEQTLSVCKYDQNHKMPSNKLKKHEEMCFLKYNGYSSEDVLLPELLDINANTVVKFSTATIKDILQKAAEKDPLFKRGNNSEAVVPLSVERLQTTYTEDERCALHDAVVGAVQAYQHEEEFMLPSGGPGSAQEHKSWLARLAEQRDRRRRRTKYRAPPKTKNYSLVLRDVIATQMELFNELQSNSEIDSHRERHSEDIDHNTRERRPKETSDQSYNKNITHENEAKDTNKNRHHRERHSEDIDHTKEETRDHSYKHKHRTHVNDARDTQTQETHRNRQHRERHSENIDNSREYTRDHSYKHKHRKYVIDAGDTYTHKDRHHRERDTEIDRHSRRYDRSEEDEQSKERDRSRREDYNGREKKHNEYRSEKKDRDKQSYGSDRKRGKYEMSYEKSDRDRSYSKIREDKYKKDYKY